MFNNKKSQLDEMQELKLLHIEKNGCWFAFWALLLSMIIQMAVLKEDTFKGIAGEWIVFMCLCVYIIVACVKNGIWDRKLKANPKTNAITSIVAGVASGIIFGTVNYLQYGYMKVAIWTGVINMFLVGIVCFIGLSGMMVLYKKRLENLEMNEE